MKRKLKFIIPVVVIFIIVIALVSILNAPKHQKPIELSQSDFSEMVQLCMGNPEACKAKYAGNRFILTVEIDSFKTNGNDILAYSTNNNDTKIFLNLSKSSKKSDKFLSLRLDDNARIEGTFTSCFGTDWVSHLYFDDCEILQITK